MSTPSRFSIPVCATCGAKVERELFGDNRWACHEHGNGITVQYIEVVPVAEVEKAFQEGIREHAERTRGF